MEKIAKRLILFLSMNLLFTINSYSQSLVQELGDVFISPDNFITGVSRRCAMDLHKASGKTVYVYSEKEASTSNKDLLCVIYNADMTIAVSPFRINNSTLNDQLAPFVVVHQSDNSFYVTWYSNHTGDNNIYAKKISMSVTNATSAAVATTTDILVNDITAGDQVIPMIAISYKYNEVVIGIRDQSNNDGGGAGSYAFFLKRLSTVDLSAIGTQFLAHSTVTANQVINSLDFKGDYLVVTYASNHNATNAYDVYARVFTVIDPPGATPVTYTPGSEILVNTFLTGDQNNSFVTINETTGDFVVTWSSVQDGSGWGAYAKIYSANAASVIKAEFLVNSTTANNQLLSRAIWEESTKQLMFFFHYSVSGQCTLKYRIFDGATVPGQYTAVGNEADLIGGLDTKSYYNQFYNVAYNPANNRLHLVYDIYDSYSTFNSKSRARTYFLRFNGSWLGTVSSDWHTAANWYGSTIPTSTSAVVINSSCPYMPVINSTAVSKSINIGTGASLQLNNVTLTVSGNWINNGTFTSVGTTAFSSTATISGTSAHTFNNLTINSGATLTPPPLLALKGNWVNSGTFTPGTGEVAFTGTSPQSILGTTTFASLKIDKATDNLTLSAPVNISSQLNLTLGKIITSATNVLNIMDNATVAGTPSNSSFVEGPMKKTGDDAFVFPVGKTIFRPVEISAPTGNTSAFTVEYFNTIPPNNTLTSAQQTLSSCEYWKVDRTTGTSTIQLTFNWLTNPCEPVKESLVEVMRLADTNPATVWNGMAATKNIPAKTIALTGLNTFGYFTFGYKYPLSYAELTQKLDGGFYVADRGKLFIQYREEYSNPSLPSFQLKYKIIDMQRNVLTSNSTNALVKQIGINQFTIPLNYCSYTDGQYYILEVTDEKNENSYLRFKYIKPTLTVTCP